MEAPIPTQLPRAEFTRNVIRRALETYPGRVALSCSFGGASGMVLLDIALALEPALPVFVVDTQLLFAETYGLIERVERRYDISVERVSAAVTLEQQAAVFGTALWSRDPDACCDIRKVEPLRRHLREYDAWLTAVRRDQAQTRERLATVSWDRDAEVVKVAPLAAWSEDDVWAYVRERDVPVNTLHFDGYPSLGCTHCTRRVAAGEDARAGRWSGFAKTECGIHVA